MTAFFACALLLAVVAAAVVGAWLVDVLTALLMVAVWWACADADDLADVAHVRALRPPPADAVTDCPELHDGALDTDQWRRWEAQVRS